MMIYDFSGWNWNKFGFKAPDYRNGDIFYVVYDNKIMAVKVTHSYLKIIDCNRACVCATFETPTKNTIFDSKGRITFYSSDRNARLEVFLDNGKRLPIYETIEDAKDNIRNERIIDISAYNVVNKDYELAKIDSCGCQYYIQAYYWGYFKESLIPTRFSDKITDLIWTDKNELRFSHEETPLPFKQWATEADVLNHLSEKKNNMEVVSFDEEKDTKKDVRTFEMTLKITTDMTTEEIAKLISEQMAKEKESAN